MTKQYTATLTCADYNVAWICPLPIELAAATQFLDELHNMPTDLRLRRDDNAYRFGRIGQYNIVMAVLPSGEYGTISAALVANMQANTFRHVEFTVMVGIGGGVPSQNNDIRLGDVVVSKPGQRYSGVFQYDLGKTGKEGELIASGCLNKPSKRLLNATADMEAEGMTRPGDLEQMVRKLLSANAHMQERFMNPGAENDVLYNSDYCHTGGDTCETCSKDYVQSRKPRKTTEPVVHYGLIASGNQVIKDGRTREKLRKMHGMLCFEMEAAGAIDTVHCLVVRGICDYADSHKNKRWQGYAALTAAAYTKSLLLRMSPLYNHISPSPVKSEFNISLIPPASLISETPVASIEPLIAGSTFNTSPTPLLTPPSSPLTTPVDADTRNAPVYSRARLSQPSHNHELRQRYGEMLLKAAKNGNNAFLKLFLNKGADPDTKDENWDITALHYAARRGDFSATQLLVTANANPNTSAKHTRNTPLFEAACNGHASVVKYLLQHGASIMDRGAFERTPLHAAAANGHLACVKLLVESHADQSCRDRYNQTPLALADKESHLEVSEYLRQTL